MACDRDTPIEDCVHIDHLKELMDTRLEATNLAHQKFEAYLNAKLETMNEIREQLGTQKSEFISRVEFEAKHEVLIQKLDNQIAMIKEAFAKDNKALTDKVEVLQKFMAGAMGGLAVLEIILRFVK